MVAPELTQYITQSRAGGFTEEQILGALRAAGWAEDVIAEAFGAPAAPSTPQVEQPIPASSTEAELTRIQQELEQTKKRFHTHTTGEVQVGGIIGLLMRKHIVTNESQANVLMIATSLLCISLSVWILWPKK